VRVEGGGEGERDTSPSHIIRIKKQSHLLHPSDYALIMPLYVESFIPSHLYSPGIPFLWGEGRRKIKERVDDELIHLTCTLLEPYVDDSQNYWPWSWI